MNKTIIININGIVFHIEEDAYDLLREYMTGVKRHFAYTPDSEEITTDIENRLAEMFSERLLAENSQVIITSYVLDITAQMGNVNEFETEEAPEFKESPLFKSSKKLFRDMDDRIIGGVCAGVSHYFTTEPRWVRIIALVLLFAGGAALPLYIILWIVMPKAITRADKMAMKGEPINIENFKKNFDEEVENLRKGFSRAQKEVGPAADKLINVIGNILKVFVKVIGSFIVFIGASTLIGLIAVLIGFLGFWNYTEYNLFPFNVFTHEMNAALAICAFAILFVPLVALVLFAVRVIFNRKVVTKTSSFAMLIIWLTAIGFAVHYGARAGSEFKEEATFSKADTLKPYSTYYLKLNDIKYLSKADSLQFNIDPNKFGVSIIVNGDENHFSPEQNVRLFIEASQDDKASVTQKFSARGVNFQSAIKSAQNAGYNFKQTESVITFDKSIHINSTEFWRNQEVSITLRIPKNTRLVIDNHLNSLMFNYNLAECLPDNAPYFETPSQWIMTGDGMKCAADSLNKRNELRNEDHDHDGN